MEYTRIVCEIKEVKTSKQKNQGKKTGQIKKGPNERTVRRCLFLIR